MPPPVHAKAPSSVQKGLLENQRASIFKILSQLSKDLNSDPQKSREGAPASLAQIRVSVTEGDLHSHGGSVKDASNGPMELSQTHKNNSGSSGITIQTEMRIPAITSGQPDAPPLIPHVDLTESSVGGSVKGNSQAQEEPLDDKEDNDPRKMMAELESNARSARLASVDINEDFTDQELRLKLSTLFSPEHDTSTSFIASRVETPLRFEFVPRTEAHRPEVSLAKEWVPYAVALQLEKAGCDWEGAALFTAYLFSSGLNGYKAQQEKGHVIRQANDTLNGAIQQFLEDEKASRAVEDTKRLPRRLIVTNIAADAQEDDIFEMFASHFKFHVYVYLSAYSILLYQRSRQADL
jgi:hypothetical protein